MVTEITDKLTVHEAMLICLAENSRVKGSYNKICRVAITGANNIIKRIRAPIKRKRIKSPEGFLLKDVLTLKPLKNLNAMA